MLMGVGALAGLTGSRLAARLPPDAPIGHSRRADAGGTLAVAALVAALYAVMGSVVELLPWMVLAAASVTVTVVDLRTHRIPDVLVVGTLAAGLGALLIVSATTGEWSRLGRAAMAAGLLLGVYLVLALPSRGGLGLGDAKLATAVGLYLGWLGWSALIVGTFLSFALGAVVGIAVAVLRRGSMRTAIPFGPFMVAAPLLLAFLGNPDLIG